MGDGSGKLSEEELRQLLHAVGIKCNQSDLQEICAEADMNRDGNITFSEFKRWWELMDIRTAFRMYDKDRSGTIDFEEAEEVLHDLGVRVTAQELADSLSDMKVVDPTRGGLDRTQVKINFEQFNQWWNRMKEKEQEAARDRAFKSEAGNGPWKDKGESSQSEYARQRMFFEQKTYIKLQAKFK